MLLHVTEGEVQALGIPIHSAHNIGANIQDMQGWLGSLVADDAARLLEEEGLHTALWEGGGQ